MSERRKSGNTTRKRKNMAVGKTDRDKMKGIVRIIYNTKYANANAKYTKKTRKMIVDE
jgi:hypothetical protein